MKRPNGFTLIEVLLAISILATMMSLVFTITTDTSNTTERVINEDREFMQVETAMSIVDKDLQNLYDPRFSDVREKKKYDSNDDQDLKQPREHFIGQTRRGKLIPKIEDEDALITFMVGNHKRRIENEKQSNFAWIRYSLDSIPADEKGEGVSAAAQYRLIRQYNPNNIYSDELDWDNVKKHVLIDNLIEFKLKYWDRINKKYVDSIKDIPNRQEYIQLIKAEFKWADQFEREYEDSRTFLNIWIPFDARKEYNKQLKEELKNKDGETGGKENENSETF